jgi:hypothetical protein
MGKYWAAINQPEARFGKVVELDDSDPSVQQRVAHGFLVPHDQVAKDAQNTLYTVEAPIASSKEDVMRAILEAREAQSATPATSSVSTAIVDVDEDADEDD